MTDKEIRDIARAKYFKRHSGYIDEQIALDRAREMQTTRIKP